MFSMVSRAAASSALLASAITMQDCSVSTREHLQMRRFVNGKPLWVTRDGNPTGTLSRSAKAAAVL